LFETEERESRDALAEEIARLRETFRSRGSFFASAPEACRFAYRVFSAAQDLRLVEESCRALIERLSHCPCPALEADNPSNSIAVQLMLSGRRSYARCTG
jgi:uncharacterized protein (DUF1778 family)